MSGHIQWLNKPSEAWKDRTNKEQRVEDCFNRNITADKPPPAIPARSATDGPRKTKAVRQQPSYMAPTKSSSASQVVTEMQTHLSRRGKRLTQLFLHADRDRSGNLDADEIRSLLVTANLPGELTTAFMAQLDKDNSGTVSMDEFSRALSNNGYAGGRDSGPKVGKIDRAMWASSAFLTAEEHARQDAKAAQREKKPSEAERRRARTKHGAWAYRDPERPDEIKPDTGKTFSERPYYTCDRQVHAWQNYHAQPNPVTLNRAHPAFPEAGPLMTRTNYTIMHGREGGGGGRPATATASPVVSTTKPRRERPQSATQANLPPASRPADPPKARPASAAAAKLSTFCDVDRYNDMRVGFRNVLTGFQGESRDHVVPNATLWTCQLARRQITTPDGIHAHARTPKERNFAKEPTAGMKWSRTDGWHVNPVRPIVDERFIQGK